MNAHTQEPPESARAISILNIRKTVVALQKRAGVPRLLSEEQESRARKLIAEADGLHATALVGDPRNEGKAAFAEQQRLIGLGKGPADSYGRDELIEERRTILRGKKARLVEITRECIPIATAARDKLYEVIDKVAAELDAEGQKQAADLGIGFFQSSLTAQVIRDLKRRLQKIVPPPGASRNPRSIFEAFLDDCAPIPHKDELAVRQEAKRGFVERTADAIKNVLADEPDRRAAEIQKANAEKEARKRQMAEQGVIKLGGQ